MYSTCKGPLIDVVEDDLKIPMEKKVRPVAWRATHRKHPLFRQPPPTSSSSWLPFHQLEIGDASEFTQERLYEQLHPAKVVFQQKFKRPMRPGGSSRCRLDAIEWEGGFWVANSQTPVKFTPGVSLSR